MLLNDSQSLFDDSMDAGDLSLWGGNDSFDMITEDGEYEVDEEACSFPFFCIILI